MPFNNDLLLISEKKLHMRRFLISLFPPTFRTKVKTLMTRGKIKKLLRSGQPIRLEIGSGPKKSSKGWTTIDWCGGVDLRWNLMKKMPFPDNSVDVVYSSHVLEHFPYHSLVALLDDCFRILKPGGLMSICVPNARVYIEGYNNPEKFDRSILTYKPALFSDQRMDLLNYIFYMVDEHKYMFDEENLTYLLKKAGFISVEPRAFDQELDLKEREKESLFFKAIKP